jgi:hypothetical protein
LGDPGGNGAFAGYDLDYQPGHREKIPAAVALFSIICFPETNNPAACGNRVELCKKR